MKKISIYGVNASHEALLVTARRVYGMRAKFRIKHGTLYLELSKGGYWTDYRVGSYLMTLGIYASATVIQGMIYKFVKDNDLKGGRVEYCSHAVTKAEQLSTKRINIRVTTHRSKRRIIIGYKARLAVTAVLLLGIYLVGWMSLQ